MVRFLCRVGEKGRWRGRWNLSIINKAMDHKERQGISELIIDYNKIREGRWLCKERGKGKD